MNLLSLFIAPVQTVVLFFAPHAGTFKTPSTPAPARHASRSTYGATAQTLSSGPALQLARASRVAYPSRISPVTAKPIHRVRVVRNVDTSLPADRAGRMRVSGRFADVCAELDRLAAVEMRTA